MPLGFLFIILKVLICILIIPMFAFVILMFGLLAYNVCFQFHLLGDLPILPDIMFSTMQSIFGITLDTSYSNLARDFHRAMPFVFDANPDIIQFTINDVLRLGAQHFHSNASEYVDRLIYLRGFPYSRTITLAMTRSSDGSMLVGDTVTRLFAGL